MSKNSTTEDILCCMGVELAFSH